MGNGGSLLSTSSIARTGASFCFRRCGSGDDRLIIREGKIYHVGRLRGRDREIGFEGRRDVVMSEGRLHDAVGGII
jgi:hypothetical protein